MIELFSFSLSPTDLSLLFVVALLIGMSKTGVHGAGMAAVPFLAMIFGGKESTGLLLPILCIADIFGVSYYHRHTHWSHLIKLFPWAAAGILIGTYVGDSIDDNMFRLIMGVIILGSLGIMIWKERSKSKRVPEGLWFAALLGLLGGFTTMVGNLAGSVMALYLLSMRLPKNEYIGTAAWFFLVVNLFKVPLHVFVWKTITWNSFFLDLVTIPAVVVGVFLGIWVIKKFPEMYYRWFIIGTTALAALLLVF